MTSATKANMLLEAALNYARRGWASLPIAPGAKVPACAHGVKDATTDVETIRQWWTTTPDAGVGIACGAVSRLLVLDVDRHGDVDGEEALAELERKCGPLPRTIESLTGGGGRQLFFGIPDGVTVRTRTGIRPGLDVRGEGSYVVAFPSIHPSGRRYEWSVDGHPDEVPLAEAPAWLLELIRESTGEKPLAVLPGTIPEGQRNSTLTSLAGSMRRRRMSEDAILAALLEENRTRCDPPLDEGEVRRIAASVARYEPTSRAAGVDLRYLKCTDTDNAAALALLYGDRVRYDHRRGRWLLFRPGLRWEEDASGEIVRLAQQTARERLRSAADIEDSQIREAVTKWGVKSESRAGVDAMLSLAKATLPIADAGEAWDSDPWLLGVPNGVVDLRTGKLRDGRPEDRITLHAGVPFDPAAACPRWVQFLGEVFKGDAGLTDFVWRACGYMLTGLTIEQVFFLLFGRGANGKSVLLRILLYVLGDYGVSTSFATFEAHRLSSRAGHSEDLANLAGARLVVASEVRENTRLDEGRIKSLTGGDRITARPAYGHEFSFDFAGKILLGVNHRPKVTDDSTAMWRRIRLIPFDRQFLGKDADPNLENVLKGEAEGILAWAVRGCLEWQRRGLDAPERVLTATRQYQAESDPVTGFLEARCVQAEGARSQSGELFKAYQKWCDGEAIPERERLRHKGFAGRMGERFQRGRSASDGRFYRGIGLLTDREPGCEG